MLWQLSAPGMQDTRKAGPRRADAGRVVGKAFERLGRGREPALVGQPGRGAAQGSQRFRHGAGAQAVRPRQLCSALVVPPLRGCLMLTWWTVSMATGMGAAMRLATTCAGIEARAVGTGAAATDGVNSLGV
jgi:hypothetical protein